MNEGLETIDNELPSQTNEQPKFLKVLCILTFVGSGLGILNGIGSVTFMTPDHMYQLILENAALQDATPPNYNEFVTWSTYTNIVSFVCALAALGGALLMWRLKKIGYFIYTASWIPEVVLGAIAYKHISDSVTMAFYPIAIALNVLMMLAFVIMYGVNVKHMRK